MKKKIWYLPNFLVEKYLLTNFFELTVDDFFQLIEKKIEIPVDCSETNETLLKSKEVLKYVIKNQIPVVERFDINIFDDEILSMLASYNINLSDEFIYKNRFIFSNYNLKKYLLIKDIKYLSLIDDKYIDEDLVSILNDINYVITKEDIIKYPIFLTNDEMILRSIENDLELILYLPVLKQEYVNYALECGYVPKIEDIDKKPALKNYEKFIKTGFITNSMFIRYYAKSWINNDVIKMLIEKNYDLKEEDLIINPVLSVFSRLMEYSIYKNPKLILYIDKNCFLDSSVIAFALKNYQITDDDLRKHPQLCDNLSVVKYLPRIYNPNLSEGEKKEIIIDCLRKKDYNTLFNLPFFQKVFNSKISSEYIQELLPNLLFEINELDMDSQEKYFEVLDNIINAIISIKYKDAKNLFKYSSIDQINDSMYRVFLKNNISDVDNFIDEIYSFVNYGKKEFITREYLETKINDLYKMYLVTRDISRDDTTSFYNEILNQHLNAYSTSVREEIINDMKGKMQLTRKKQDAILRGVKLKKISKILLFRSFQMLGISDDDMLNQFLLARENIKNNKKIKKKNIDIPVYIFEEIECMFLDGKLSVDSISYLFEISDIEVFKIIIDEYEKIKMKFLDRIDLEDFEKQIKFSVKSSLGFDYNNYTVASQDIYYENIASLLLNINDDNVKDILYNKEFFKELFPFLPFFNLNDVLDTTVLIKILSNYKRIRDKLIIEDNVSSIEITNLMSKKFSDVVMLGNGFSACDDLEATILGRRVVEKVNTFNTNKYFEIYNKMVSRYCGGIPRVCGEYEKFTYESANYADPERLLIGKNIPGSCIDIGGAGGEAFEEVLTKNSGDVIILRDKETTEFYGRILMFRRGNVVQLAKVATFHDSIGTRFYKDFFYQIAKQIIDEAIKNNDNIDYVFATESAIIHYGTMEEMNLIELVTLFPHADLTSKAYLIGAKTQEELEHPDLSKLDFTCTPKGIYLKPLKKVRLNATLEELTRIKALRIKLESDEIIKDELSRNFEPVYSGDFIKVISAEDWYIGIKKDGSIEEVIVPNNDQRQTEEINIAKETLIQDVFSNESKGNK